MAVIYNGVPNTRTINGKPLNQNITLTPADVGALNLTGGTVTGATIFANDLSFTTGGRIRYTGFTTGNTQILNANASNNVYLGNPTLSGITFEVASTGYAKVSKAGTTYDIITTQGGQTINGLVTINRADAGLLLTAPASNPSYILSKVDDANNWYLGKGSNTNNDINLHSYIHNTYVSLRSDGVYSNRKIQSEGHVVAGAGKVIMGAGPSDVFITNTTANKYLQLKDTGVLSYADDPIVLKSQTNLDHKSNHADVIGKIPYIGSNGVMEIAQYIDFHAANSTVDYDVRLAVSGTGATGTGTMNLYGTFAPTQMILTSQHTTAGNTAQIFHNGGASAAGTANVMRSMREHNSATWVWEKIRGGVIEYSTGTTGAGTNNIQMNVGIGTVSTTSSMSSPTINATGTTTGTGITFNGKTAIGGGNDSWLRINPHGNFSSGIYCGSGLLRTDGNFQVGDSGSKHYLNANGEAWHSGAIRSGADLILKNDGRKHIVFQNSSGAADGYIYKDIGGSWNFNHGTVASSNMYWSPNGELVIDGKRWGDSHSHSFRDSRYQTAPVHVDFGVNAGTSDYYPIIQGRHNSTNIGYVTNVGFGILRSGNDWGRGIICISSAESDSQPMANFEFLADGQFYCPGNGNFNDVYIRSDRRLKSNFASVERPLDKVCSLTGWYYDKKSSLTAETTTREFGIIAQDLEAILPEAVNKSNDDNEILSVSNSAVNALLVEAIKELRAEVNALKAELNLVKGK